MSIKILGQAAPGATTETTLYTVPANTTTVISSIVICNRNTTTLTTFRISVAQGGGATANKDYLYYDVLIPGADTFIATVGITLAAADVVRVYAGNANLSFNAFGEETP